MLSLIKSLFSGNEAEEISNLVPDYLPEEVEGLNFPSAIEAHMKWKSRLNDRITGQSNEPIDIDLLSRDDKCVLGQWIYAVGMNKYKADNDFVALHNSHAAFHRSAGNVMHVTLQGQREQALAAIAGGEYAKASLQVVRQLTLLWRKLG